VKDALTFSYELACEGTFLQGSELVIEETPVVAYCPKCEREQTLDSIQRFCCPACGTLTPDVVSGKELELVAIEISEISEGTEEIETNLETTQLAGIAP
jgi:hydrogenase nickel incorporation protein HypA/HybF